MQHLFRTQPKTIRILHIFNSMGNAGTENFVMNYYRHIDRKVVQFDFLIGSMEKGYFDDEIQSLGGHIFHIEPRFPHIIRYWQNVRKCVSENGYDIVHRHTGSAMGYLELRAARRGGATHLILHSHNPRAGKPWAHYIANYLFKTDCIRLACSKAAGSFLFGKDTDYKVIPNAIDLSRFKISLSRRQETRKMLGIGDDEMLLGHIGRFAEQKNHRFLITVFSDLCKTNSRMKLICLGQGELESEIRFLAKKLLVENKVIFMGQRDDVVPLLEAMDVFVFPSLYEGLGIVAIEAQAMGLPVIASVHVPTEVDLTGLCSFLELGNINTWSNAILNAVSKTHKSRIADVKENGYNITEAAISLQTFYRSLVD